MPDSNGIGLRLLSREGPNVLLVDTVDVLMCLNFITLIHLRKTLGTIIGLVGHKSERK